MISQLTVGMKGDRSQFRAELNAARTDAAKFANDIARSAQSAQSAQQRQRATITGGRQLAEAGGRVGRLSNAAAALSGVPGMGDVGNAISQGAGGVFGLKMAAESLGMSMAKAGGVLAVFAVAGMAVNKAWEELKKWVDAVKDEARTQVNAIKEEKQASKAYMKVLDENRKELGEAEYRRLGKAVNSTRTGERNAAMKEIRSRFGGTALNPELLKQLEMQKAQNIPDEFKRARALEAIRFQEEQDKLRSQIGSTPSEATQKIAAQLWNELQAEHLIKMQEIMEKQLAEQKTTARNTQKNTANPFR